MFFFFRIIQKLKGNIVSSASSSRAGAFTFRAIIIVPIVSFLLLLFLIKIMPDTVLFLDYCMYDVLISNNLVPPSPNIVAVLIDDDSINGKGKFVGLGRWPWPRSMHAKLIKKLLDSGAKAIGFDVYFARKTDPKEDNALIEAIREAKGQVVVAHLGTFNAESLNLMYGLPEGSIELAKIGGGEGNIIRSLYFQTLEGKIRTGETYPYPLSYEIARRMFDINPRPYWDRKKTISDGAIKIPVDKINAGQPDPDLRFFFPFSEQTPIEQRLGSKGSANRILSAYDYLSYIDVINGNFNKDFFRNKAVIVYSDFNEHDKFPVPVDGAFNGGEIHANALQAILNNKFVVHKEVVDQIVLIVVFVLSLNVLFFIKQWHWRLITLSLLAVFIYVAHYYTFRLSYQWVKITLPLIVVPLNWFVAYSYEHRKVRGLLARFVPKRVYDILILSDKAIEAGKKVEEATILFSDIRGYTTLSEAMGPEELAAFMREYHAVMEEVVAQLKGEVMYYQGDAQMVAFRYDKEAPNFAERGVAAGMMMQDRLALLNDERAARGDIPIQIGIGITTGEVAFGMVGEDRLSYTALGDVVNTASRLQGMSIELSAAVLIDKKTCESAKNTIKVEELEPVRLKGKNKLVKAYKLLEITKTDCLERSYHGKAAH